MSLGDWNEDTTTQQEISSLSSVFTSSSSSNEKPFNILSCSVINIENSVEVEAFNRRINDVTNGIQLWNIVTKELPSLNGAKGKSKNS